MVKVSSSWKGEVAIAQLNGTVLGGRRLKKVNREYSYEDFKDTGRTI